MKGRDNDLTDRAFAPCHWGRSGPPRGLLLTVLVYVIAIALVPLIWPLSPRAGQLTAQTEGAKCPDVCR
jgi:hypothetical protein